MTDLDVQEPITAKLGGISLWVPPLKKQNFTITYEENNIARFSFLLQNCDVNRTAITDHLADDFVIYRGATAVFTGTINSDGIEYLAIDKIRIPGYAKSIKLGYEFFKHMLSADAEAVGSMQIYTVAGGYTNKTTAANSDTVNDIEVEFNNVNEAEYVGHDETFYTVKTQYSTKGINTEGLVWTMIEDTAETSILSLVVFGSYLYAGTSGSGKIYRSLNGTAWTMVEDTTDTAIYSLAVFGSYLYAGTGGNGKIYRSANGTDWTMVEDTSESDILSLAVFDSYLYAGTGGNGKIYRSANGTDWTMVEDTSESDILSLAVFDSYLYAGTGNRGKIYRSANGTDWTMVEDTTDTRFYSLAVFGSYLYAGAYPTGKIYQSLNGTDWTMVEDTSETSIRSLAVFGSYLYAGTGNNGKLYRSLNGTAWTMVEDTTDTAIYSLAVFGSYLYAGTGDVGKIYRSEKTAVLKTEYSKGSGSWGALDCIDTSQYYTEDIGEHYLMIQNKPSDWAKDTVNGISKFWIRKVSVSGSYSTNPQLDRMWISQTDVCRVQFDNMYLDDMLDDVLIDTDYSFQKALVNSTFEAGVASWTGDMTQSSTQKHGGTYSAKLIAAAANVTMDSEFLPAAGVKDIAFWTYLISLTTPPFRYSLMYYDRNQTYISSEIFMTLTSTEVNWTEHEYTHDPSTFPAGTKYVKLSFDFWNAGSNPAGTVYIDDVVLDSTVPHIVVPGMRGEYYSKLQWVAGLANAATWEDGDENKQNYLWWIDSDDLIHIEQSTGITYNDITSSLSVLNNKLSYFDMGNRLFGLGSGDGINQTRAAVEDIAAQTANGVREALVTDARILEYEALKEFTQKALTVSKAATKVITLNMPTFDWFEGGYAISDTIKLRQPIWGIPDETTYRIIRCDIGKDRVKIDVGDPRQHLDTLQADLKAQIDVSDVYMHGATNIYQVGPIIDNMERTASAVFPLTMKIRIADDAVKINKVLLNWSLSGYRTFSTVASSEDLGTISSQDGGLEALTSGIKNEPNFNSVDEELTLLTTVKTLDEDTKAGDNEYVTGKLVNTYWSVYGYHSYSSDACTEPPVCILGRLPYDLTDWVKIQKQEHKHKFDSPVQSIIDDPYGDYHEHSVKVPNHAHSVSIPDHQHDVILGSHSHPLDYGIMQESLGSPTLELIVNGNTVGDNYTSAETDINIAGYMTTGWNTVELQPKTGTTARLRAQLDAFVKVFIESR